VYKENHVKGIIDKKLESFVDGEVFFIRVVGGDVKVNRCKPEQNSECYHDCLIWTLRVYNLELISSQQLEVWMLPFKWT